MFNHHPLPGAQKKGTEFPLNFRKKNGKRPSQSPFSTSSPRSCPAQRWYMARLGALADPEAMSAAAEFRRLVTRTQSSCCRFLLATPPPKDGFALELHEVGRALQLAVASGRALRLGTSWRSAYTPGWCAANESSWGCLWRDISSDCSMTAPSCAADAAEDLIQNPERAAIIAEESMQFDARFYGPSVTAEVTHGSPTQTHRPDDPCCAPDDPCCAPRGSSPTDQTRGPSSPRTQCHVLSGNSVASGCARCCRTTCGGRPTDFSAR